MVTHPHAWRVHENVASGIIVDARDYYRSFFEVARTAKRSILLLGWQFDSDVRLLRGTDLPKGVPAEAVELLPFLDGLCATRPELEVRILAWDHSLFFALERELLQKVSFALRTSPNFHFENDASVPTYGAHHQKVAIIDGRIAFVGSCDICQDRWDTSEHACGDELRVGRSGKVCKPYHEVQSVLTGAAARSLVDLFVMRWAEGTGQTLDAASLVASDVDEEAPLPSATTLVLPRATVSLYRQLSRRPERPAVREVRDLFASWIATAERSIYIETQYFTSEVLRDQLVQRMREADRPRLDVVVVLPHKPEALKEELAVGGTQVELLRELTAVARETGHRFGVYNVASGKRGESDLFVYIHAKLMIVDDRRLTVGSANLNNRSMSLDSELNAAWETEDADDALGRAIRGLRGRLLAEHTRGQVPDSTFDAEGLVERLDALAAEEGPLRAHERDVEDPSPLLKLGQQIIGGYADPPHSPESRGAR